MKLLKVLAIIVVTVSFSVLRAETIITSGPESNAAGSFILNNSSGQTFTAPSDAKIGSIGIYPKSGIEGIMDFQETILHIYNKASGIASAYTQNVLLDNTQPSLTEQVVTLDTPFPIVSGETYAFIFESLGNSIALEFTFNTYPDGVFLSTTSIDNINEVGFADLLFNINSLVLELSANVSSTSSPQANPIDLSSELGEPDEIINYELIINNISTVDQNDVVINNSILTSLPNGVTLFDGPTTSSGNLTETSPGEYTLDVVPINTPVRINYSIKLPDDSDLFNMLGEEIENNVSLGPDSPVTNLTIPLAELPDTAASIASISSSEGTPDTEGNPNETVTYEIQITNPNSVDISGPAITNSILENLPNGITLVDGPNTSSGNLTETAPGEYTLDISPANDTVTISYSIKLTDDISVFEALGDTLTNIVTIYGNITDLSIPLGLVTTGPTTPITPPIPPVVPTELSAKKVPVLGGFGIGLLNLMFLSLVLKKRKFNIKY